MPCRAPSCAALASAAAAAAGWDAPAPSSSSSLVESSSSGWAQQPLQAQWPTQAQWQLQWPSSAAASATAPAASSAKMKMPAAPAPQLPWYGGQPLASAWALPPGAAASSSSFAPHPPTAEAEARPPAWQRSAESLAAAAAAGVSRAASRGPLTAPLSFSRYTPPGQIPNEDAPSLLWTGMDHDPRASSPQMGVDGVVAPFGLFAGLRDGCLTVFVVCEPLNVVFPFHDDELSEGWC